MNITFIGGGNMARAIIGGLLAKGHPAADLRVVEIVAAARTALEKDYGVATFATADAALANVDCIVLAVKPQQLRETCTHLGSHLERDQCPIISIAAGIRLASLMQWLGGNYRRLIRAMPNTPALIGKGMTALYAARPAVSDADFRLADAILAAVGKTLRVTDESALDAVTAVSGSGPAYVFYFIEALEAAARELGLDAAQARTLALETFVGAANLAAGAAEPPAELRARVTSKGGTTEAALASMTRDHLKETIIRAVQAAAARSRALGDELDQA
ncbi:MAG: pyrroline-5-carboxylate reductase [Burkholderiales bacterium]